MLNVYNRKESYSLLAPGRKKIDKRKSKGRMLTCLIRELRRRDRDFPDVRAGIYVYEVIPGTAAESAGLQDGDIIIAINGKVVTETRDVMDAVQNSHTLAIVVRRGNEDVILTVVPDEID